MTLQGPTACNLPSLWGSGAVNLCPRFQAGKGLERCPWAAKGVNYVNCFCMKEEESMRLIIWEFARILRILDATVRYFVLHSQTMQLQSWTDTAILRSAIVGHGDGQSLWHHWHQHSLSNSRYGRIAKIILKAWTAQNDTKRASFPSGQKLSPSLTLGKDV